MQYHPPRCTRLQTSTYKLSMCKLSYTALKLITRDTTYYYIQHTVQSST